MAYRSKLMRLIALFAFACLLTQSYAEDAGINDDLVEGKEDKSVKEINDEEIIHRRDLQLKANGLIQSGDDILKQDGEKDYPEAIAKYTNAEKQLNLISRSHPDTLAELRKLKKKLGSCYAEYAQQLLDVAIDEVKLEKFKGAEDNITKAVTYDASLKPRAQRLLKLITQKREQAEIEDETRPSKIDPEHPRRLKEILIKKAQATVFRAHRQWKRSREAYESILLRDPANEEAIAGLENIYVQLREAAQKRRRASEAERMAEIEWKWIDSIPPTEQIGITTVSGPTTPISKSDDDRAGAVRKKLEEIIITKISFVDTRVSTVFEFLKNQSRNSDTDGEGVNFLVILKANTAGRTTSANNPIDDVGEGLEPSMEESDADGALGLEGDMNLDGVGALDDLGGDAVDEQPEPTITMDFDNIPLGQAIRYICEQANLKYKVEEHAVVILGPNVDRGQLELRFFPIDPDMVNRSGLGGESDGDDGGGEGGPVDFKRVFEGMGVSFNTMADGAQASISYDRGTNQLVVRNTHDQLRLMERIIKRLNVTVPQVTIEAKFVEVRQNSLEELSFKWVFQGNRGLNPKLYQAGQVDVGVQPGALTGTTRSMSDIGAAALGETFNLDTIIGASQFNTLVYFLNRKDGTDVLSAPKVTVQSGQEAFISMVEERMFPESFDAAEFQTSQTGGGFTPSSPVFGEPRSDIGVVLTVTPQVAADNLSISLSMHPKVTAFMGYDTTFNSTTTLVNGEVVENRYDTPIFETRELRTEVTVWDGESVVLGGTITDELTKVMDKVPIIGDLPMIGRLFQSKGEASKKKNLLIFVSARIIDPAGVPIRDHDIRGLPDFRR